MSAPSAIIESARSLVRLRAEFAALKERTDKQAAADREKIKKLERELSELRHALSRRKAEIQALLEELERESDDEPPAVKEDHGAGEFARSRRHHKFMTYEDVERESLLRPIRVRERRLAAADK